jgi:DhnA family fructose-bisphosphate aldolase class Ia
MNNGIDIRMNRIFSSNDNRALCIACDHGLMTDPHKSWLNISEVISGAVYGEVDALLLSSGQIRQAVAKYGRGVLPPFIIRTDWTNLLRLSLDTTPDDLLLPVNHFQYRRLLNAEDVLYRYGGTASIGFLFIDPQREVETLTELSSRELIEESHKLGLPCIIEILPLTNGNKDVNPLELINRGVLIALELGADAIKMPLTDDIHDHCSMIHSAGKRIIVLGGSSISDEIKFKQLMQSAIDAGVDGLLVGRNVSHSTNQAQLIKELQSIVHPLLETSIL